MKDRPTYDTINVWNIASRRFYSFGSFNILYVRTYVVKKNLIYNFVKMQFLFIRIQ